MCIRVLQRYRLMCFASAAIWAVMSCPGVFAAPESAPHAATGRIQVKFLAQEGRAALRSQPSVIAELPAPPQVTADGTAYFPARLEGPDDSAPAWIIARVPNDRATEQVVSSDQIAPHLPADAGPDLLARLMTSMYAAPDGTLFLWAEPEVPSEVLDGMPLLRVRSNGAVDVIVRIGDAVPGRPGYRIRGIFALRAADGENFIFSAMITGRVDGQPVEREIALRHWAQSGLAPLLMIGDPAPGMPGAVVKRLIRHDWPMNRAGQTCVAALLEWTRGAEPGPLQALWRVDAAGGFVRVLTSGSSLPGTPSAVVEEIHAGGTVDDTGQVYVPVDVTYSDANRVRVIVAADLRGRTRVLAPLTGPERSEGRPFVQNLLVNRAGRAAVLLSTGSGPASVQRLLLSDAHGAWRQIMSVDEQATGHEPSVRRGRAVGPLHVSASGQVLMTVRSPNGMHELLLTDPDGTAHSVLRTGLRVRVDEEWRRVERITVHSSGYPSSSAGTDGRATVMADDGMAVFRVRRDDGRHLHLAAWWEESGEASSPVAPPKPPAPVASAAPPAPEAPAAPEERQALQPAPDAAASDRPAGGHTEAVAAAPPTHRVRLRSVVRFGQPAVGLEQHTFLQVEEPAINARGDLLVSGRTWNQRERKSGDSGAWIREKGQPMRIVTDSRARIMLDAERYFSVALNMKDMIGADGSVLVSARTARLDGEIISGDRGSALGLIPKVGAPRVIAATWQRCPVDPRYRFGEDFRFSMHDQSRLAFGINLMADDASEEQVFAIYAVDADGSLRSIARPGATLPGLPGVRIFRVAVAPPVVDARGRVSFVASLISDDQVPGDSDEADASEPEATMHVLRVHPDGTVRTLLQHGAPGPDGTARPIRRMLTALSGAEDGAIALVIDVGERFGDNRQVVVIGDDDVARVVMDSGPDQRGLAPGVWFVWDEVVIARGGYVLTVAGHRESGGTPHLVLIGPDGSQRSIGYQGQRCPEDPKLVVNRFVRAMVNASGHVVAEAMYEGVTGSGLYLSPPGGALQRVLIAGQELSIDGTTYTVQQVSFDTSSLRKLDVHGGGRRVVDDHGVMVFRASLREGGTGIFTADLVPLGDAAR